VARLIAVANQTGGVAKTTTVHSLGYALAELGRRVLLVDLDPQACLTYSTGIDANTLDVSLHDVFQRRTKATDVRLKVAGIEGLEILPAAIDLGASEIELLYRNRREFFLSYFLSTVQDDYDFVLIDCPPSLGVLTINGLTAAAEVVIPFQCEALSTRGVGQLLETIDDVRMFTNNKLRIRGVVATMFDGHARHARDMLAVIRDRYGLRVLDPPVRKSIRFAEAPHVGRCILQHAPSSPGAEAYRSIALDIDAVPIAFEPEPPFAPPPALVIADRPAPDYASVS
jgi:chromosome partitioning protein